MTGPKRAALGTATAEQSAVHLLSSVSPAAHRCDAKKSLAVSNYSKAFLYERESFVHFRYSWRTELRTQSMATPESAKTAAHMEA